MKQAKRLTMTERLCGFEETQRGIVKILTRIDNRLRRVVGKENKLMSQATDLAAAVEAVKSSETSQEARIDAIIALLESRPDDPIVTQAIADLAALKGQQDAYRADPAPDPAA
jgi:hypothetical protein